MDLARRSTAPFTRPVTFANDSRSIGVHSNAHFGDIDGEKRSPVFPRQDAACLYGLAAPGVEAEDSVGLRDREPALDVGEFTAMGLACADMPAVEISPQRR